MPAILAVGKLQQEDHKCQARLQDKTWAQKTKLDIGKISNFK